MWAMKCKRKLCVGTDEEKEVAGDEVCLDELDDEAVELTTDEPTTVVAVDFSETIGGRSR